MELAVIILGLLMAVVGVIAHMLKGKDSPTTPQITPRPAQEVLDEVDKQAEQKLEAIEAEKEAVAGELAGDPEHLSDTAQQLIDRLRSGRPRRDSGGEGDDG
jgi:hypothetical protein